MYIRSSAPIAEPTDCNTTDCKTATAAPNSSRAFPAFGPPRVHAFESGHAPTIPTASARSLNAATASGRTRSSTSAPTARRASRSRVVKLRSSSRNTASSEGFVIRMRCHHSQGSGTDRLAQRPFNAWLTAGPGPGGVTGRTRRQADGLGERHGAWLPTPSGSSVNRSRHEVRVVPPRSAVTSRPVPLSTRTYS